MEAQEERPARKQVDTPVTALEESNDMTQYNIWTHRKLKGFRTPREGRGVKTASQYRCHPQLDVGWTRGSRSGCTYFCIYFARGICHMGRECAYLHRLPSEEDEVRHRTQPQYDIFGRDRVAEGGSKGVGSYNRQCTTLYVYLGGAATLPVDTLHKLLTDTFSEWGPIEDLNIVPAKAIAFVRYASRAIAEFAKTATHQQTLATVKGADAEANTAVLDVRWANDDPNPKAQQRVKRAEEDAMAAAYMKAVDGMHPDAKRARLHEIALSAGYLPGAAASAYPDTSAQYEGQYEGGWDARAYAEAGEVVEEGAEAVERGTAAGVGDERGGEAAAAAGEDGHDIEDDVSRYLMPGDILDEYEYEEGDGSGGLTEENAAGRKEVDAKIDCGDGGGGRENVLVGLLGDYGSDSE